MKRRDGPQEPIRRRALAIALGGVGLLGVFATIAATRAAIRWHGQALVEDSAERWRAAGRDLDQALARHPDREPNASALELERLARGAGLQLAPRGASRREHAPPDPAGTGLDRDARGELRSWLLGLLESAERHIPEAPVVVTACFDETATAWDAIEHHLQSARLPAWAVSLDEGLDSPSPFDPFEMLALGDALLARALVAEREGRPDDAERSLEAAWRLSLALASHPPLLPFSLARHDALLSAAARELRSLPPDPWRDRFESKTHGRSHQQRAAEASTLLAALHARSAEERSGTPFLDDALLKSHPLGSKNFIDWSFAWVMERQRRVAAAIDRSRPCSAQAAVATAVDDDEVPAWVVWGHGQIGGPALDVAFAWEADAQLELTAKVLAARAARASGGQVGRTWRAARCPEDQFRIETLSDGGFHVERRGPGADPETLGLRLPLVHVEPPPG